MRRILALLLVAVAHVASAKLRAGAKGTSPTGLIQETFSAHAMASLLKTSPPFELDPATFPGIINAVPTDIFLLFYSPTCPDCERLMPIWTQIAGELESNQDVTLMSVADDEGKAQPPFKHTENPALFYIPKNNKAQPISFPMAKLHVFVSLPETKDTDHDMYDELMNFANSHGSNSAATNPTPTPLDAARKANEQPRANDKVVQAAASDPSQEPKVEEALNARLLATLKAHESEPLEAQKQLFVQPPYNTLPVAKFLAGVSQQYLGSAPLADMAARYLDGEPLARKWAVRYAQMELASYRSSGWWPTPKEQKDHFEELIEYALPLYARSIYVQTGGPKKIGAR